MTNEQSDPDLLLERTNGYLAEGLRLTDEQWDAVEDACLRRRRPLPPHIAAVCMLRLLGLDKDE